MIFGKKTHLIGLDIGSRTIKIAEVVDKKTTRIFKNFHTINIEPVMNPGMLNWVVIPKDSHSSF